MQDPDIVMSLYGIIEYIAGEMQDKEWGYILQLLHIGANIVEAETNSVVQVGDIVVRWTYDGGTNVLLCEAQIIFDGSSQKVKSVAF